jgi:hypothetical protein
MLQTKTNPPTSSENEVLRAHILDELPHVRDRIRLLSACAPVGLLRQNGATASMG